MISALASVALAAEYANTTGAANDSRNEDLLAEGGGGGVDSGPDGSHEFPAYIRTTSMVFCIFILGIGIIGNVMVPLVILKSRDMRNSTNIFLTNLSIADLMVLLVCTPTVLVEVNSKPETWVLGSEMCKAVPFVELTVAHASVLTILAISFERYYAICEPLKAGYVCTKERALLICFLAWAFAALFTSPILAVAEYRFEQYWDGTLVPVCITPADTFWKATYFVGTISVFFGIPLVLLVALYSVIARHLMVYPGIMASHQQQSHQQQGHGQPATPSAIKYRKQVVMMLGTVVLSFFICLLPFRAFTLWIIVVPPEDVMALGAAGYYNLLFFCRIMLYLNSAINPILYNLMSSKFRDGFMRLCGIKRCKKSLRRKGTFNTTTSTTTCSSSQNHRMSPEGFWRRSFTSGRGSLGGDSLRGVLQRKASTTSSDSAGAGPADRPPPHLLHAAVGGRRLESAPGMTASAAPLLNGGSVHHPLMEDVLEDVLEDALEAGTAPRVQDSGPKLGDEWC